MKTKLEIIKKTRKIAADSLCITLKKLLDSRRKISEVHLRNAWLKELNKHKEIFQKGWYTPPPFGMGVLFASEDNFDRVRFKTLRQKEYWPKKNVFLDTKKGFALFYCSPVHKTSGIIGDFGISIYFGENKKIQKILADYLKITKTIFYKTTVGNTLSEVHNFAKKILHENGFTNEWWVSITDPTGTNLGHTIPAINHPWNNEQLKILNRGERKWQNVVFLINKSRKFVNAYEQTNIRPEFAFTIEPRAILEKDTKMPTIYFHTIALFYKNGRKELLTDFNKIFRLIDMDYML